MSEPQETTQGGNGSGDGGYGTSTEGVAGAPPRRRSARVGRVVGVSIGALLGLGVIFYATDLALSQDRVARGAEVSGLDLGGLRSSEARDILSKADTERRHRTTTLTGGGTRVEFVPADAGIGLNLDETMERITDQPLNPVTRLRSFFTHYEVAPVTAVDEAKFRPQADRAVAEFNREARDASVVFDPEQNFAPRLVEPVTGLSADERQVRVAMVSGWLSDNAEAPVKDVTVTESRVAREEAERVLHEIAEPAASADVTVRGYSVEATADAPAAEAAVGNGTGGEATATGSDTEDDSAAKTIPADPAVTRAGTAVEATLGRGVLPEVITFTTNDEKGTLDVEYHRDKAQEILAEQLAGTTRERKNASVALAGASGGGKVSPAVVGRRIDWDKTLEKLPDLYKAQGEGRSVDGVYTLVLPDFTTKQAENAGITEVIGEFTTSGFADASGTNIRRVAEQVNGVFLRPGGTFSLNGYTGPRGTAQGYVESGVIIDGHADKAVGGGISQFATTLYNASYFAGMTDVSHTPHSYYISRYPAGREATVYEGAIDLVFRNDYDTGVIIQTEFTGKEITVRLWGTKHVSVESQSSPRTKQTKPERRELTGDTCEPSDGADGFTITDTRIIRDAATNRELKREDTTTVYDPQPIITCK